MKENTQQLKDKVAVITGASTGIGRSIAVTFAEEGAKVVLAARNEQKLDAVAKEIRDAGGEALTVITDVAVEEDVISLFQKTVEAYGQVDILVNNAGVSKGGPPDEISLEIWRKVIETNVTGAFLCSREALRLMKPRRSGRIINIGSISAKVPRRNSAPYAASKFALEGMTRSMALDMREFGIAVSVLQPGNTETEIWTGREEMAKAEGVMSPDDLARIALLMVTLPANVNFLEGVVLPVSMPFLGRS